MTYDDLVTLLVKNKVPFRTAVVIAAEWFGFEWKDIRPENTLVEVLDNDVSFDEKIPVF